MSIVIHNESKLYLEDSHKCVGFHLILANFDEKVLICVYKIEVSNLQLL